MKLRWFTEMNRVTAADVEGARLRDSGFPLMTIKVILEDKTVPRLQYLDFGATEWVDVPHVVEYREGPLSFKNCGVGE